MGEGGVRDSMRRRLSGGDPLEEEDERGIMTDDDMANMGDMSGKTQKLRITCPSCGQKQKLALPAGVSLDEAEDEEEDEAGGIRTIDAECRTCEREVSVAPPDGYKFKQARGGREAAAMFFHVYNGGSPNADASASALETFRESYRNARNAGRASGWPSQ
jgi:hypothetical protein